MKNRNGAKGGRKTKKRSEGASPGTNKGDTTSPALRSVVLPPGLNRAQNIEVLAWGLQNSRTRIVELMETLAGSGRALRDLLRFYDRATGSGDGTGWTATDVRRLEEIRNLVS
jgi:hypothetical protein